MIYTLLTHLLWIFQNVAVCIFCNLDFEIHLLLFLSSRLPSCRIPSCWMDGIHAICLSTKKKVVTESLRRGIKGPTGQVVNFWLVMFWLVMFYSSMWSGYTPLWFRSTFCCVYIMAAWTQDISEILTELKFEISQIDENHCSQMKIRLLWPWSPRKKIRGRTSHQIILAGDAYV